ncbi:MAG TPA: hypothetical protein VI028_02720 [Solirubrobacterales bacterium]
MGLMDNIKKAQEMAQQAGQGGQGNMSPSAGDVEYANLAMKLNQNYLTDDAVNAYQPAGRFQIKADPDDTSKVMLYGQA